MTLKLGLLSSVYACFNADEVTNTPNMLWTGSLLIVELREHVTVLIGIAVRSLPVAGVIHQPFYHRHLSQKPGRTIWGLIGLGAFGMDKAVPAKGFSLELIIFGLWKLQRN